MLAEISRPRRESEVLCAGGAGALAYKSAVSDGKRVVITLEIPPDALTNLERPSVVNKETAKYRANKAKVLKIEDEEGIPYPYAETAFYEHKSLVYIVGELIEEKDYDSESDKVCSRGIHFFLSKRAAELYQKITIENRIYEKWDDEGNLREMGVFKNGERDGKWRGWHASGKKFYEEVYKDGRVQGLSMVWYENEEPRAYTRYNKDGKMEGMCIWWHDNGKLSEQIHYKDGKEEGHSCCWYENGQKKSEGLYKNGEKEGVWREWFADGNLLRQEVLKDGTLLKFPDPQGHLGIS